MASCVSTVPCSASGGEQWSAPTGPNTEVSYQKHISRIFLKLKKWTLFDRYYGFSAKYLGQCRLVSAAWGTTTPHLMFPPHWQVTYHPPSFSTWKSALPRKESSQLFLHGDGLNAAPSFVSQLPCARSSPLSHLSCMHLLVTNSDRC